MPMQAAPCDSSDAVCSAYGSKYARSWFTPQVYRLPSYASEVPLQRTWLIARLTSVDEAGFAAEPCVTHDEDDTDIEAVLLLHPPGIIGTNESVRDFAETKCSATDLQEAYAAIESVRSRFSAASKKVEHYRRFVISLDRDLKTYHVFEKTITNGLDAWSKTLAETIRESRATFVNRGGSVLTSTPPVSGIGPLVPARVSTKFGNTTARIAAAAMGNYMG